MSRTRQSVKRDPPPSPPLPQQVSLTRRITMRHNTGWSFRLLLPQIRVCWNNLTLGWTAPPSGRVRKYSRDKRAFFLFDQKQKHQKGKVDSGVDSLLQFPLSLKELWFRFHWDQPGPGQETLHFHHRMWNSPSRRFISHKEAETTHLPRNSSDV